MAGYQVMTVEDALPEADIYVTTTGNSDVITAEHMARMKDQAIVCNIGHFDNEIQVDALEAWPGSRARTNIKPQVDKFIFPDGHSIFLLAEGPAGEPGLRHRPPELRDVATASPTRCWRRSTCGRTSTRSASTCSAQEARRGGRAAAPGQARRQADEADARSRPTTSACRSRGRTSRSTTATEFSVLSFEF